MNKLQKGQGLIEYALVMVLVAVIVIVLLALLKPNAGCDDRNNITQQCITYRYNECVKTELFSRQECAYFAIEGDDNER